VLSLSGDQKIYEDKSTICFYLFVILLNALDLFPFRILCKRRLASFQRNSWWFIRTYVVRRIIPPSTTTTNPPFADSVLKNLTTCGFAHGYYPHAAGGIEVGILRIRQMAPAPMQPWQHARGSKRVSGEDSEALMSAGVDEKIGVRTYLGTRTRRFEWTRWLKFGLQVACRRGKVTQQWFSGWAMAATAKRRRRSITKSNSSGCHIGPKTRLYARYLVGWDECMVSDLGAIRPHTTANMHTHVNCDYLIIRAQSIDVLRNCSHQSIIELSRYNF